MVEFSVAVHTYNRANYICETIDSILTQTLKPKEIIIIDDDSNDNTEEVLKKYGNQIIYRKIDNVGCGASRKVAVDMCSSEWVACNDDDDIWLPNHLETLSLIINSYPETKFCFTNFSHFGDSADVNYNHFSKAPSNWWESITKNKNETLVLLNDNAYIRFLDFNPATASTWAFRKKEYLEIGGINQLYSRMNSEDADLTRRMLMRYKGACSETQTVKIRKHGENMSISFVDNLLGKAQMLEDYIKSDYLPEKFRKETKKALIETLKDAFSQSLWNNDFIKAKSIKQKIGFGSVNLKDKIKYVLLSLRT
jgi:glycosyltransferase involved in cell wall biosynthesis